MTKTFRVALLEATGANGPSLKAVSDATGVSYEQLKKLKQGKSQSTNVDDALAIAGFLGATIEDFIADPRAQARSKISALLAQLTDEEMEMIAASAHPQR